MTFCDFALGVAHSKGMSRLGTNLCQGQRNKRPPYMKGKSGEAASIRKKSTHVVSGLWTLSLAPSSLFDANGCVWEQKTSLNHYEPRNAARITKHPASSSSSPA